VTSRVAFALLLAGALGPGAWAGLAPPVADAVVDLRTGEGAALVQGQWRYRDAAIVEVDHRAAGPDHKPSGAPNRTHDLVPRAGVAGFDDSDWELVAADDLERRRSSGRLSAGWYRLRVTLPEKVGEVEVAGASIWFEIVVDDYAEVWIDGRLPLVLGETAGAVPGGWNVPNRLLLTESALPGRTIEIAVLAINGPLSDAPANYVWIRSATLDLYRPGRADPARAVPLRVDRRDPRLDAVVSPRARVEQLADGFRFTEGPVWVPDGYLLFSDPNANVAEGHRPELLAEVAQLGSGLLSIEAAREGRVDPLESRGIDRGVRGVLADDLGDAQVQRRHETPGERVDLEGPPVRLHVPFRIGVRHVRVPSGHRPGLRAHPASRRLAEGSCSRSAAILPRGGGIGQKKRAPGFAPGAANFVDMRSWVPADDRG